jgi:hypothetical protein
MQSQEDLYQRLQLDVDRIATDFINDYGLKFEEELAGLSEPLLRWLDFTTRYIAPTPRAVLLSNRFPKTFPPQVEAALLVIEQLFKSGQDVNPYQSKGLILHNDTSGTKRQQRTDLLWADWGIHHLHLTTSSSQQGSYFMPRSDWILFCLIGNDFVGFIDVKNHSEQDVFSDPDLIKAVAETWPKLMERFRIEGVFSSNTSPTPSEITTLRREGISPLVKIHDQVYMGPGSGVTGASTPTRVSLSCIKIRRYIRELSKMVFDTSGQFKTDAKAMGLSNPEYSLERTAQGLAVFENVSSKAFVLPRQANANNQSYISELHDLVAPSWAINFAVNKLQ